MSRTRQTAVLDGNTVQVDTVRDAQLLMIGLPAARVVGLERYARYSYHVPLNAATANLRQ